MTTNDNRLALPSIEYSKGERTGKVKLTMLLSDGWEVSVAVDPWVAVAYAQRVLQAATSAQPVHDHAAQA